MIIGYFHGGSGVGNQLARYIFVRCKAKELDVPFGMIGDFKGDFIDIDMGEPVPDWAPFKHFNEERVNTPDGVDIRPYDPKTELIEDNTIVDGEFQDPKYFDLADVQEWLPTREIRMWDNVCVINFRGGEYVGIKDLFLPIEYWNKAIEEMRKINKNMKFEVHTDDEITARLFFPDFVIKTGMDINWRSVRYAHYLILSNSSFGIIPALLNTQAKKIIAPKWWAGYNVGYWKLPQNHYKQFEYIHHEIHSN